MTRLMAASAAMSGDMASAAAYRKQFMAIYPEFRLADWPARVPFRDAAMTEHFMSGMRRAGFE
jgi:hypothetical protein